MTGWSGLRLVLTRLTVLVFVILRSPSRRLTCFRPTLPATHQGQSLPDNGRLRCIRRKTLILFEQDSQIVLILVCSIQAYSLPYQGKSPLSGMRLRNTTMESIKTFVTVATLSLFSSASLAQSVSATTSTLDRTEAKIAAQATEQGALYKITST